MLEEVLRFFRVQTTPLVGMDISSTSVKWLELARAKVGYRVVNYGIESLPPDSVIEKNLKAIDKVAEVIRKLASRAKTATRFAAISVSGASVITRVLQINVEYTEEQIADQIEIEADRYIPYPLEEVYYDFELLGPAQNPNLVEVLLAAARIETVDTRVAAVTEGGLKVTIVDVESLAMERAMGLVMGQLPAEEVHKRIALIDLGSTATTLHVFQNLRSIYAREQVFGGKHLTDEIQKRYGLSFAEALAAQKYGGLPEDYQGEVLEPFKETVVQQVTRALQVYFSSNEEGEIGYLLLAGGLALLPGLESMIQQKVGVKTIIANPFQNMEIAEGVNKNSLMEEAPSLMITCGLALRTFEHEPH